VVASCSASLSVAGRLGPGLLPCEPTGSARPHESRVVPLPGPHPSPPSLAEADRVDCSARLLKDWASCTAIHSGSGWQLPVPGILSCQPLADVFASRAALVWTAAQPAVTARPGGGATTTKISAATSRFRGTCREVRICCYPATAISTSRRAAVFQPIVHVLGNLLPGCAPLRC